MSVSPFLIRLPDLTRLEIMPFSPQFVHPAMPELSGKEELQQTEGMKRLDPGRVTHI
jgi:hypothetical protein